MGTGYTRNDTGDNIADGNVINASDLDGEFDALQSAFDNSTGHTHDGTAAEGAPIEKVGPNQEVVVTATVLRPAANNTIDLGVETTNEFKNLYIDGTAYLDSVDIDGGTIDGLSVLTVDNLSLNGNTITSTDTNGNLNLRANGTGIISVDATDVNFGDSDKATFGDGSDLQIYHDGTNSRIEDINGANLILRSSADVRIDKYTGENMGVFNADGSVDLYYDNSKKLATTNTGIAVTGDVDASDDLILSSDSSKITFGADGDVELEHIHNVGLTLKTTGTGDDAFPEFILQSNEDTIITGEVIGRIDFDTNSSAGGVSVGTQARITVDATDTYSSTVAGSRLEFYTTESGGALNKAMVIDPDQSIRFTGGTDVKLDATNDTLDFPDNFKIMMGAGDDLQIYHDGSNSYVDATGTGHLILQAQVDDKDVRILSDDGSGGLAEYIIADGSTGEAKLSFAASGSSAVKLKTTSTGVDITGGFTATDGSTITVNDNSVALDLICTDTDASSGPVLRLSRDVAGAASDVIGTVQYYGQDVAGNDNQYAEIKGKIGDATNGAEDGELVLSTMVAGTIRSRLNFSSTEAVFNDGSQDINFRVESNGNANMLFVDGGNNRVGVGTNAPAADFHVNSGADNLTGLFESTDSGATITLIDNGTTGGSAAEHGLNTVGDQLEIRAVDNLSFETGGAGSEAMRISSTGNVGIGHGTPDGLLHLKNTDSTAYSATATDGQVGVGPTIYLENPANTNTTVGGQILFGMRSTEEQARIGATGGTAPALTFGTGDVERMRLTNDGNVGINNASPTVTLDVAGTGRFLKTTNNSNILLETTDTDANAAPVLDMYRNSASPANGDQLGKIEFSGENSNGDKVIYGYHRAQARTVTAGDEKAKMSFAAIYEGSEINFFEFDGSNAEVVVNEGAQNIAFRVETPSLTHALCTTSAGIDGVRIGTATSISDSRLAVHNGGTGINTEMYRSTTVGSGDIFKVISDVGGSQTFVAGIEANGDIMSATQVVQAPSDIKLKQDIVDATSQWDDIKALQLRNYRMKSHVVEMGDDAPTHLGVIAQEVEAAGMTGLVDDKPDIDGDLEGPSTKIVKYTMIYLKAVKALQEAMAKIETLEAKVAALEAE